MSHGHVITTFQAAPPLGPKEGFQFLVYSDMGDPDHHRAKAPGCALNPDRQTAAVRRCTC